MSRDRCEKCVFRAEEHRFYRCNYAYLMKETRKAEPPEQCTHFIEGKRLETPGETILFLQGMKKEVRKVPERKKLKRVYRLHADWGRARELYDQRRNDMEIAAEIGATRSAVQGWRRRNGLPSHLRCGKQPAIKNKKE